MASEMQLGTGLEAGEKKGLYKELRQNPYLLGLSAVRHTFQPSQIIALLTVYSLRPWEAFFSVMTREW